MREILLAGPGDRWETWRAAAKAALAREETPETLFWREVGSSGTSRESSLLPGFVVESADIPPVRAAFKVPAEFTPLGKLVACHRDPARWNFLYRLLWRLTHGEPRLLQVIVDPDVHPLLAMQKSVRRDLHKMKAFVRFREITEADQPRFLAWFEPEHFIVERIAPFFTRRFAAMRWSILTPDRCAHWEEGRLWFSEGVPRSAAPNGDDLETLWLTYYRSIFNPARLKVKAMQTEMPQKYWKNLPEAAAIHALIRAARPRTEEMIEQNDGGE